MVAKSVTRRVHAVSIDAGLVESLTSAAAFRERYGVDVAQHLNVARDVADHNVQFNRRVAAVPPWVGYFMIDPDAGRVVGAAGFKGNPTREGSVEIAYFTFPEFEGRGFATATAQELVRIASESGAVRTVLAHTLPERKASVRVLEKLGFALVGEVMDPEDGRVWRWQRAL